jgi:DNA-binding transcriptional MerR regulator
MFALNKDKSMNGYSVKQLGKLAGVSVRTLHLYDETGLLKPSARTAAGYRLYGEKELLRLQQILFYKELDFPLREIKHILDDPDFDLVEALHSHKQALLIRKSHITELLGTIDKTISHLNGKIMLQHKELYAGLPKEQAEAYRKEAIGKYGQATVDRSELGLSQMSKEQFESLKAESTAVQQALIALMQEDPASQKVQELIARHYACIRKFWGTDGAADPQFEAYEGLGQLYLQDERFTLIEGRPNPAYAAFLSKAMTFFANTSLR